jgi:hypothetical protein
VGESVAANTSYGISVGVQRKSIGSLIQDSTFMIKILTGINLLLMKNASYNTICVVEIDMYGEFRKSVVPYFSQMGRTEVLAK